MITYFESQDDAVMMKDIFDFQSPLGFIGRMANGIFLTSYMTRLLIERNRIIKEFAESEKWKQVLPV